MGIYMRKRICEQFHEEVTINIRSEARRKNIRFKDLAERMGLTASGLSQKMRYGGSTWSLDDVVMIADALGVDYRDLLPPPEVYDVEGFRARTSAETASV